MTNPPVVVSREPSTHGTPHETGADGGGTLPPSYPVDALELWYKSPPVPSPKDDRDGHFANQFNRTLAGGTTDVGESSPRRQFGFGSAFYLPQFLSLLT